MEKLIELLNEYRREKVNKQSGITEWHYNAFTFSLDNISGQQAELLIISKQYGFIKWLVDNDKIDRDKINRNDIEININRIAKSEYLINRLKLTMLLSIQDEPIRFLCEILK